jgi:membrane protease YdiL (CAAX protease family)
MRALIIAVAAAVLFWLLLFGLEIVNFWWGMTIAAGLLAAWSLFQAGRDRRSLFAFDTSHIAWGLMSAFLLYAVFWAGNYLSRAIFDFAAGQIESIYMRREQLGHREIALLLFFVIAPAEEIFWRGMVQRILSGKFGSISGWLAAALIYAAVHLWAGNFVLFMAALICGLFWGWIYMRFGSLWPGIISHAVWDILVFLIVPL